MKTDNSKTDRFFKLILVLSLIVNAFFLGFFFSGHHRMMGPPPDPGKQILQAVHKMDLKNKADVLLVFDKKSAVIDHKINEGRVLFKRVHETLTQENIDPVEIKKIFEEMGEHHKELGLLVGDMFVALYEIIPDPEERKKFFEAALPPEPPFPPPHEKHKEQGEKR